MVRSILVGAALIVGISAAIAQGDPIAERKNIMKGNGAATRVGTQMIKGEAPFDVAKAREVFAGISAGMTRFPTLFPQSTKTGDTRASPRIWEDPQGFSAAAAKIVQDSNQAASAVTDLASFQANFQRVTANCGSCHEAYRVNR